MILTKIFCSVHPPNNFYLLSPNVLYSTSFTNNPNIALILLYNQRFLEFFLSITHVLKSHGIYHAKLSVHTCTILCYNFGLLILVIYKL